jgi:hypothetical protein
LASIRDGNNASSYFLEMSLIGGGGKKAPGIKIEISFLNGRKRCLALG